MSGNPYLMYVFARYLPQYGDQVAEADKELRYVTGLLHENGQEPLAHETPGLGTDDLGDDVLRRAAESRALFARRGWATDFRRCDDG